MLNLHCVGFTNLKRLPLNPSSTDSSACKEGLTELDDEGGCVGEGVGLIE